MKKSKGITLIALVITIIVLLILAGVTIASLSGDNGILTRGAEAKEKTRRESIQEELDLWKTEKTMEENIGGNNMNISDFVAKLRDNKTITLEEFNEIETTNKLTIGRQDPIIFPNPELSLGAVIPDGCTYTTKAGTTYNSGENMPSVVMDGDKFITNEYTYVYHMSAFSHGGGNYNNWEKGWNVNNVSDKNKKEYGVLYVKINGEPVTSMYKTFSDCSRLLESPIIPSCVINMNMTFMECINLTTTPEIPNSVALMDATFLGCKSITTVSPIGNSVTILCDTFENCDSLTKAPEIPNSVTIMKCTFNSCDNLSIVPKIPDSVTIMDGTFHNCINLTKAPEIPNSVTNMESAFSGCSRLIAAPIIPENVTNMDRTFMRCTSLRRPPEIPSKVTDMSYTFHGCTSLTTAPEIPKSVTNMRETFSECSRLITAPIIPENVTNMDRTFFICASLKGDIIVNASNLTCVDCCFSRSAQDAKHAIVLKGTCSKLNELKKSGYNNGQFITIDQVN